jgi:hypothetical protein
MKPVPTELTNIQKLAGVTGIGSYWNDVQNPEKLIEMAAHLHGKTVAEIKMALLNGAEIEYEATDWESTPSKIRDRSVAEIIAENRREKRENERTEFEKTHTYHSCKSCGQSGYSGTHPFSTCPDYGYCDDCL